MKKSNKTLRNVKVETTGDVKSSKAPKHVDFQVKGRDVSKFCRAAQVEAAAKKAKENLKANFFEKALSKLFRHNLDNPDQPLTTVKVTDDGDGVANISFKDVYSVVADREKAIQVLSLVGAKNVNDFLVETVKAKFDMGIFDNEDGSLNEDLYNDMIEAIAAVAAAHNKPNPLSTEIVVKAKSDFHARRWYLGRDGELEDGTDLQVDDQHAIFEAVKNTVSTTPVRK